MVSILSASEMKKPKSKREPVNAFIDLRTDEPYRIPSELRLLRRSQQ
jgi:hypothetical protein